VCIRISTWAAAAAAVARLAKSSTPRLHPTQVTGANEWKVIFKNITFKILGIPVVDKKPLPNQAGIWRLTYLDEELRILYAAGLTNEGKPAKVSNIYILKRV
jgi:hypothetical protein